MNTKKAIFLFVALLLIYCSFISCKPNEKIIKNTTPDNKIEISDDVLKEDAEFVKKIENISSGSHGRTAYLKDLGEFIHPGINLIVRCQIIAREESTVTAFGIPFYSNDDLRSTTEQYLRNAISRIATPYQIQINEVYHGKINKEGDVITIYALYGIVDGFENKMFSESPIYNVGAEYILFLRVEEEYEHIVYIQELSCLKLDTKNGTFESLGFFGNIYDKYGNNTDNFITDLKELIKSNNYSTEMSVHGSIEDLQEIIDQRNQERAEDGLNIFIANVLD
jgi:hypothetical protein